MFEQTHLLVAVAAVLYTVLVVGATVRVSKQRRAALERSRTLLVELNSNNQTARIRLVPTKDAFEGYQVPNGPFVKFEGNRTYIDREHNRPVVVYNGDTGFPIKATTGEASEMDGIVMSAALASHDWEAIQRSHGGIPWVPLAIIVGLAIVILPIALLVAFKSFAG